MIPAYLFFFGLGILSQSLLYIKKIYDRERKKLWLLPCVPLISLIGMLPGKHEEVYDVNIHIFYSICVYAAAFGWYYRKEIISVINEQVLLQLSLITIYALFSLFGLSTGLSYFAFFFMILPAGFLIYLSLHETKLGFAAKLSFYVWYIVLNITLLCIYILSRQSFTDFLNLHPIGSYLDFFLLGFNLFYLIINVVYLYELIPIPNKSQSFEEKMVQWSKFTTLLTMEYKDEKLEPLHTFAIIILQGGFLLLNYYFKFLPTTLVISVSIVLTQFLIVLLAKEKRLMKMSVDELLAQTNNNSL